MSDPTPLQAWVLPRLKPLMPWPISDGDLLEAISYAASFSTPEGIASHFRNLLGESPESLTFISEFNHHRFTSPTSSAFSSQAPTPRSSSPAPNEAYNPTQGRGRGRKKKPLNNFKQAPRRPNDGQEMLFANPQAVYMKKDDDLEDAFYAGNKSAVKHHSPASTPGTLTPTGTLTPATGPSRSASSTDLKSTSSYAAISKPPGKLTSDLLASKRKPAAAPPKPDKYVYTTTGGTAMRGATKELSDLESALRTLEISTNPTLSTKRIPCPCQGTTHEVLLAAPNCLACGKIICIKEGLGPCTFCGTPLLTPEEVQDMVRSLREDAGREKMAINATQNRRAEVAKIPRPFTAAGEVGRVDEESLKKAQEHRDRLLGFQATSAQRTRIIDQAADFETPLAVGGLNQWATPAERALQLKRQQKTMRMMDWHAKEAYEKRKVVVAIDLKGRRVVKEMRTMEAPVESDDDEDASGPPEVDYTLGRGGKGKQKEGASSGGAFARNPLLKGLIKPVYVLPKEKKKGKGNLNVDEAIGGLGGYASGRDNKWRRVQDSLGDNERVILDGGIQGGAGEFEMSDEIACG